MMRLPGILPSGARLPVAVGRGSKRPKNQAALLQGVEMPKRRPPGRPSVGEAEGPK